MNNHHLEEDLLLKTARLERELATKNRELEIEAALEKVRSRSLAMHKSEELQQIVTVAFERLKELNISMDAANIVIFSEGTRDADLWIASPGQEYVSCFHLPYVDHLIPSSIFSAREKGNDFFANTFSFEEKNKYFNYLFEHSDFRHLPENRRNKILAATAYAVSFAFTKNAAISIHNYSDKAFSDEENNILRRFARVFEQAYIRFLDLQKAEAQSREAQVQLALERVRARTMAMQRSDELPETAAILFEQFKSLGQELMQMTIGIVNEADGVIEFSVTDWSGSGAGVNRAFNLSIEEPTLIKKMYSGWKENKKSIIVDLTGKELEDWINYRNKMSGVSINSAETSGRRVITSAFFSRGHLSFSTPVLPADESIQLLERFAQVFDLTYTRFLDLKKAETQAREAQIELGLERVRARAMAMQKSDELSELVATVFKELTKLDFALTWCIINIIDESSLSNMVWAASPDINKPPESYHMLFEDYPFHHAMMKGWKERRTKYVYVLEGLEKKIYDEYLFNETEFRKVPEAAQAASRAMEKYVVSFSFSNFGGLQTVGDVPLSDASLDILSRFGKVFDLTYTRFNDLKQAEAQARESQIQLALERVRARTMAMQRSDELMDAASLLFKQLQELGVKSWSSGFNIWQDDGISATINMCNPDGSIATPYHLPHTEDIFFIRIREARQKGDDLLVMETGGKELEETYNYMFSLPEVKKVLGAMEDTGFQIPKFQVNHCAFFSQGYLMFITYETVPEMWDVFKRFAKVFEQTYTRFLDLQKAEAQVREAQIEAALEKVRSRSLAMHHSKELKEVVKKLFEKMKDLGFFQNNSVMIVLPKNGFKEVLHWTFNEHFETMEYNIPAFNHPVSTDSYKAWERGEKTFEIKLNKEEKDDFLYQIFTYTDYSKVPDEFKKYLYSTEAYNLFEVFENHCGLLVDTFTSVKYSEDQKDVVKRFAKVFEQAYIRFLDLQKAETQAREAQIEAALERVRSRTMGMQKSDELKEVIQVVYEQFGHLSIKIEHTGFVMDYKTRDDYNIWIADPLGVPSQVTIPYFDSVYYNRFNEAKENGEDFFATNLSFEEKSKFYQKLFEYVPGLTEEAKKFYFSCPGLAASTVLLEDVCLYIENFSGTPYTDEENKTLMRFGRVFQQTYTRFLDLQKAEAQAREAKIEASLEKVRSRTMAMQRSQELAEVATVLFQQVKALGVPQWVCGFSIFEIDDKEFTWYPGSPDGDILTPCKVPLTGHPVFISFNESRKRGDELFVYEKDGEFQAEHYRYMMTIPGMRELLQNMLDSGLSFPTFQIDHIANFSHGNLVFITYEHFPEMHDIFKRFAKVFDLTYTRFLDLQKAEAQARESQIQLALERVRARTMAMQKSDELPEAANLLFQQVQSLGMPTWSAGYCIWDEDKKAITLSMSRPWGDIQPSFRAPLDEDPSFVHFLEAHNKGEELFIEELSGKALVQNYKYLRTLPVVGEQLDSILKAGHPLPTYQVNHCAYFSKGFLLFITYEQVPESHGIFKRFAKVFDQTYTRFLDLQKAEAQAREAKIEAGLERVRAQAMAMHNSEDLGITIEMFYAQVSSLLDTPVIRCGTGLLNKENSMCELVTASKNEKGQVSHVNGHIDMAGHPMLQNTIDHWKDQKEYYHVLKGMEIKKYYQHMTNQLVIPDYSEHEEMHFYFPMFSEGSFYVVTESELSAGELQVVRRFSSVLSLTYRRFNDLKKAEAQAREAQIEAALERVRARTMAMQKSEELAEAAEEMFKQVNALGAPEWSCGFDIFDQDEKSVTQWISGGSGLLPPFKTPLTEHSFFKTQIEARHQKQDFMVMELGGQELEDLYDYIFQFPDAKKVIDHIKNAGRVRPEFQVMHFAFFSQGYLLFITYEPVPEMWDIFKRFAKVFEQTYTRFLDLQKAEAQAREAIKQASIDRIRAEIASMRTTGDLERITPLVWNELTTLGVPFIRCGVFIMDEEQQQVQSFLSTPDGKAIAAFRQPYNSPGEVSQVVEHWHQKKIYKQHWNEAEFIEFTKNLVQQGAITSGEKYLTENRPTDLYLHFLPFMQGMLYAGSTTALSDDELQLVQNLADAFATAYARYEDFNKLEVAKQQIEMTLDDLKQAQQQLVQSEKMASLGELTAGIAHEIQNPLNFVNNFSDVNKELLEELKEEADKGNIEEIKAIANDIINNEAKINHHGKRADAIVKNMLQHSRSSGATKELTDINKLADEYLRLSYHGLRAKDKSFNSDFKTYFDGNIGKVNVIPQDIGRVLLNLFNNAFYAVNEKLRAQSSQLTADYKPLVSVQTKKIKDKIELRVSDNGNGIPRNIVDKIFQPFFTTKPTGQGTGLGLSLSYDIIKAHGGEIKVETREGEGSEFVIQLICGN